MAARFVFAAVVVVVLSASVQMQEPQAPPPAPPITAPAPAVTPATATPPHTLRDWLLSNGPADYALVLIGLVTAVVALRTLKAIERQVGANITAANAAEKSADAAVSSAKIAETTMYLQLRARLGLRTIKVENFIEGSKPLAKLIFQNFGGKGALLLEFCVAATLDPLPPPASYAGPWQTIGVPLEAGDTYEGLLILPQLTPDVWQELHAEPATLRCQLYGAVKYEAGFRTTKTLRFCWQYEPALSRATGSVVFGVAGGAEYNRAE